MELETNEIKEQLEKALEKAEEAGEAKASPEWITSLSLSTALIAVLAAIVSLESGVLGNRVLLSKNEAVLAQARTSDQWSYYQAKGIKAVIYQVQAELTASHEAGLASAFSSEARRYKAEQDEIKSKAAALENEVQEDNERAERLEHQEHLFSISVTLFQVAIALSAVGALTRRRGMWYVSLGIAAFGILFSVLGLGAR